MTEYVGANRIREKLAIGRDCLGRKVGSIETERGGGNSRNDLRGEADPEGDDDEDEGVKVE